MKVKLILLGVALGVYLKTLSPSILYIDSGAIITAAYTLGIPNPPGFPTYVIIAHLFTKIPLGSILFRVQLLSLVSALGVLTLVYFLVQRLISTNFWFVKKAKSDSNHLKNWQVKLTALSASLILAFSYQFWSQTLNTESYIFTNLLMISLLSLVLTIPEKPKGLTKRLVLGAALLGIASGANPIIAQSVPALALGVFFFWKQIGLKKLALAVLITTLLGVAVYSYLPLRASQYPFLNWGNPQTPELFWGHLRGEGLNIYDPRTNSINGFTGSPLIFARSVGRYFYLTLVQFTPVLVPILILGVYYLWQKNKRLLLILSAVPVTNLIFGGLYLSGNQESWFISSYIIFAIFIGIGLSFLMKVILQLAKEKRKLIREKYVYLFPLALALIPFLWWFPKLDRSSHIVTKEYADNLYGKLPSGSILIGSGDFFNSLSNYEHEVVKRRADVFPVVANMWYILPWYRDNLRHQRPDLMPYELEGMIKKDRLEEYNEVMNWYIKWLINRGHPVYVTPTVFRETVLAGTDAGKYVPDKKILKAVPMGLSFRMLTSDDLLQPSEDSFKYQFKNPQFYNHPPFYLERNYKAAYHLFLEEYGIGYLSLADYFANNVKGAEKDQQPLLRKKATEYVEKAYRIAPFSPEIVNRKAIFTAVSGDIKGGIKYFKEALGLKPESFEIRLNLGKTLEADGQIEQAKKQFEAVVQTSTNPQIRDEALTELSKITARQLSSNLPSEWKIYKNKNQGFSFQYPPDWEVTSQGKVTVLAAKEEGFTITMFAGFLAPQEPKDDWLRRSPIKFLGKIENKGPAQIPPFEAWASFWREKDGKRTLEFVLMQDKNILHLKVGPVGAQSSQKLDQILSTIKFRT